MALRPPFGSGSAVTGSSPSLSLAPALALLLALVFSAGPSEAGDAARYATSRQPHWKVGDLDKTLSAACRRGRFNQLSDMRLWISYRGQEGTGVTGVARKGWNLRDPEGRAEADATYHFADDGLSTCRVYVARDLQPATR